MENFSCKGHILCNIVLKKREVKTEVKNEIIKNFNFPYFEGVEVLSGRKIVNNFRRHIHKTFIIGIVEEGGRIIVHSKGKDLIKKKEVFILNPEQVHTCSSQSKSGHSYKLISISSSVMKILTSQISETFEDIPFFKKVYYKDSKLSDKILNLFKIIEKPESDFQIESTINSFLSYVIINFSTTPPVIIKAGKQKDSIKRVENFIINNYSKNISLKELSEIACLSPFHFQREFIKSVGITPHEFLNDFRISESKKMLLESEDISDIAIRSGFFDQSHFSRVFRKTVGIPPGKYCKINKKH